MNDRVKIPRRAWIVLLLVGLVLLLFYADRHVLSLLKTTLAREFDMNNADYSLLVLGFMVPYTFMYLFTGRWADRWGIVVVAPLAVLGMSAASIVTSFSEGKWSLMGSRVLLGIAEAGIIPCTTIALMTWFPLERRAFVFALKGPIQTLGPVFVPPFIAWITLHMGWRPAFVLPGIFGLVVAWLWWTYCRNPPNYGEKNVQNEAEPTSFREVLNNPALRKIILARVVTDPFWFFYLYWHPGFLQEKLGLSLTQAGRILWIPPVFDAVATIILGLLSDRLVARGWFPAKARVRTLQLLACLAPCAFVLPFINNVAVVIGLFALIHFMCDGWII
ncbi:MAG TPA: MFS transporter, partial [Opitutaceae bacterium]|nr:MFS transporter [Opitutaceae bacterium]